MEEAVVIKRSKKTSNQNHPESEADITNISSDIKPVTYLKSRAADLLKQINETHRPAIITQNGEPKAAPQDPQSFANMRNAIGILKLISVGEEDFKNGNSKNQKSVSDLYPSPLRDRFGPDLQEQEISISQRLIIAPWRVE